MPAPTMTTLSGDFEETMTSTLAWASPVGIIRRTQFPTAALCSAHNG